MASGLFSGKTVLLLAPLVSSTCSLFFGRDEHFFLSGLTKQPHRAGANKIIPSYFGYFFERGVFGVLALLGVTCSASVGAIYYAKPLLEEKGTLWWYGGAASMAVAHLLFSPWVIPSIKALDAAKATSDKAGQDDGQETNAKHLEEWLRVNFVRTVTVDLAAFLCAFIAVGKTMNV